VSEFEETEQQCVCVYVTERKRVRERVGEFERNREIDVYVRKRERV